MRTTTYLNRLWDCGWLLLLMVLPALGQNLVTNGELEAGGKGQPSGWSKVDGLTVTWTAEGKPGKCLVFHPAVTQAAKKALEAGTPSEGPTEAVQGEAGQYGTVGAHEGVWAFAAPIDLTPKDRYFIVEVDVRGPRSSRIMYPQVLLRGYQRVSAKDAGKHSSFFQVPHEGGPAYSEQFGAEQRPAVEGDLLQVWRKSLVCRLPDSTNWHHFQMAVKLPTTARYRPEVMLLKPYAMWPLGDYCFDNLVFRRCDKAEYDNVLKVGHTDKDFR